MNTEKETLTKVSTDYPTIKIVRHCIEVKQGDNAVYLTKNDVNALKMLKEGKFEDNVYTGYTLPRVRYALMKDNNSILATCSDDGHDDVVVMSPKTLKRIINFRDENRPRIAWDRDFRRKW